MEVWNVTSGWGLTQIKSLVQWVLRLALCVSVKELNHDDKPA